MNKNRRMRFFDTVKYAFFIDLSRLKDGIICFFPMKNYAVCNLRIQYLSMLDARDPQPQLHLNVLYPDCYVHGKSKQDLSAKKRRRD